MIASSARRLRAKRRQYKLAWKMRFTLAAVPMHLHNEQALDEHARPVAFEDDFADEMTSNSLLHSV